MQGARRANQAKTLARVRIAACLVVTKDDSRQTTAATDISILLFSFLFRYILCRVECMATHTGMRTE